MLNSDFRDILQQFTENKVSFLVVGAYALAAHGFVRATGDIDLWIQPSEDNAKRVIRALAHFGAPVSKLDARDFTTLGTVLQIGVEPVRIDILTQIDGIPDFDKAFNSKVRVNFDGIEIPVLSKSDLIINKRTSGRPKDRADLDWLEKN